MPCACTGRTSFPQRHPHYRSRARFEPTPDERRLIDGLIDRRVLGIVVVTIVASILVGLWQRWVGAIIFAVGLIMACQLAAKIIRSSLDE